MYILCILTCVRFYVNTFYILQFATSWSPAPSAAPSYTLWLLSHSHQAETTTTTAPCDESEACGRKSGQCVCVYECVREGKNKEIWMVKRKTILNNILKHKYLILLHFPQKKRKTNEKLEKI